MRLVIAAIVLLMASSAAGAAQADPYRWCAEGLGQSGSSNCYFLTLEQCRASASGLGGICVPNGFYTAPAEPASRTVKRRK